MSAGMTGSQEAYLSVAKDADVPRLMQEYGFEFAGPTDNHSFLFKTLDGRAWLLSDFRGKVAPVRVIQPSAWTEMNLDYFKRHAAIQIDSHTLGHCHRFANGETCVGCGDSENGTPLRQG